MRSQALQPCSHSMQLGKACNAATKRPCAATKTQNSENYNKLKKKVSDVGICPRGADSLIRENHYSKESEATPFVHSAIGEGQKSFHFHINSWKGTYLTTMLPQWFRCWRVLLYKSFCSAEDQGLTPGLGRSLGEGNGNPLQYPCLWRRKGQPAPVSLLGKFHGWKSLEATIHGVAKSQTGLKDFTSFLWQLCKFSPWSWQEKTNLYD